MGDSQISDFGQEWIELYHLKRKRLCDLRKSKIEETIVIQKLVRKYREAGQHEVWQDLQRLLDDMAADEREYAATVRAVLRDPDAFAI